MARRRSANTAFSLFSFQDIITSVTGIMILITLILAIELLNRVEAAPNSQTKQELEKSVQTIKELEREIKEVQSRVAAATKSIKDLPSLDLQEVKDRTNDLEADSDRLQREIDATEKSADQKQSQLDEAKSDAQQDSEEIEKQQSEIQQELDKTQAKLREIEQGKQIFYKSGIEGKRTWLVEITGKGFRVAPLGEAQRPQSFEAIVKFARWASKLNPSSDAFFLVVKPGGTALYEQCAKLLRSKGFVLGSDAVPADRIVLDPETGAGQP